MRLLLRIITLILAAVGYVVCRAGENVNEVATQPNFPVVRSQPIKFSRRMLTPLTLNTIRLNVTLRAQFCSTCRPRNCQRRALRMRCSVDSRAKKCACCNFCPEKWRFLRSTDRPVREWAAGGGLKEVIGMIQNKLPPETAQACERYKVKCSSAQICLLNIQNLPVCRCPPKEACGRGTTKTIVCADNGETYLSRCHLLVEACRLKRELQPARQGPCRPGADKELLAEQVRVPLRRKELRRRQRKRFEERNNRRRYYKGQLLRLIASNQRERRRLLREMKRFRRIQRRRMTNMK